MTELARLLDAFAGLEVLVIGDTMLDCYLHGTAERLCPEAPVPVVALSRREDMPGGAANTAANVVALGARVVYLSVIGDDPEGAIAGRVLEEHGVTVEGLFVQAGRRTLAKHRVVAGAQILLRLDQGSTDPIGDEVERRLIQRLEAIAPRCDAIVVSDYGYGVLTPRVIEAIARLHRRSPSLLIVDAKDLTAYRDADATVVKPNYSQAARLLGLSEAAPRDRVEQISAHGQRLLELTGARIAAVTLDVDGAIVFEAGRPPHRTYARPAHNSRAAGAGDTFVSAFALALAAGAYIPAAAELASAAAAVIVSTEGTTRCSALELHEQLAAADKYVTDVGRLAARLELYRRQGRRIVFTNGCFDILHRGHITYLNRAKALGDVLVIGLNSDESVRRLKGPSRPINCLQDRAEVLTALSCVDHIVPFDEDTPVELIRTVRPDVFVKGGDYTREMLPEAPVVETLGGEVCILPYVEDRSTTGIIERIRTQVNIASEAEHSRPLVSLSGGDGGGA